MTVNCQSCPRPHLHHYQDHDYFHQHHARDAVVYLAVSFVFLYELDSVFDHECKLLVDEAMIEVEADACYYLPLLSHLLAFRSTAQRTLQHCRPLLSTFLLSATT
eukprot:m.107263 g.107263  ORF g.107263 m.107263 type:complete len:105 (+) comp15177_c0_seq4:2437-2751(+)